MEKNTEYEEEFNTIKRYLALKPESTKVEVSCYTQVSLPIIDELIEKERLEQKNGYLVLARKRSMTEEKRRKLIEGLSAYRTKKEPENQKSKLVEDLENKYGRKSNYQIDELEEEEER